MTELKLINAFHDYLPPTGHTTGFYVFYISTYVPFKEGYKCGGQGCEANIRWISVLKIEGSIYETMFYPNTDTLTISPWAKCVYNHSKDVINEMNNQKGLYFDYVQIESVDWKEIDRWMYLGA